MSKSKKRQTVIVSARRTPIGKWEGRLRNSSTHELGSSVISAATGPFNLLPKEILMGNVIPVSQSSEERSLRLRQNPAKEASTTAGLGFINATTINKVCSSGLKSVMLADQIIRSGDHDCILAGGVEKMSGLPREFVFSALQDSLGKYSMFEAGDWCAKRHDISREAQDDWAIESYNRARNARWADVFRKQMVRVDGCEIFDEISLDVPEETKIRTAKPFQQNGTVTKYNASKNADGAAACLLMKKSKAEKLGIKPLAAIISHSSVACNGDTRRFTEMPPRAIAATLEKAGLKIEDISLFEINAAFASVLIFSARTLNIPLNRLNIWGDAISLGHPLGATGAILLVKAIHGLKKINGQYGVVSLCNALGEATAMVVENCD